MNARPSGHFPEGWFAMHPIHFHREGISKLIIGAPPYYNLYHYHESLNNGTPADVFYGRQKAILETCELVRNETNKMRQSFFEKRIENLNKQEYITH